MRVARWELAATVLALFAEPAWSGPLLECTADRAIYRRADGLVFIARRLGETQREQPPLANRQWEKRAEPVLREFKPRWDALMAKMEADETVWDDHEALRKEQLAALEKRIGSAPPPFRRTRIHYTILEGRFQQRPAFILMASPPSGTGWMETNWTINDIPQKVVWGNPKRPILWSPNKPVMAASMVPTRATGPLAETGGSWEFIGCQ